MIIHDTIHGMQYTGTLTDEQHKTITDLGISNNLSFHVDGMVSAYEWDDMSVKAYTFYKDGSYITEERAFTYDGWETERYAPNELDTDNA